MDASIRGNLIDNFIWTKFQYAHEQLINAAFIHIDSGLESVRRPSISNDGTPINYSLKLDRGNTRPAYRMIVEPGGTHLTIPEQIEYSLQLTKTILEQLDWHDQYSPVESMARIILPADQQTQLKLVGGIWLGLSVKGEDLDFRMYINLRYGNTEERWKRIDQLLRRFGAESAESFMRIKQQTEEHAMPIGFCLSIVNGKIRGVRLYITYSNPTLLSLNQGFLSEFRASEPYLKQFASSFVKSFGPFSPQSVTMGYDFRYRDNWGILPTPVRFKLEISCMSIPGEDESLIVKWAEQQLNHRNISVQDFRIFRQNLLTHFEGSYFHYITLGVDPKSEHLTFYTQPLGLVIPKLLINHG